MLSLVMCEMLSRNGTQAINQMFWTASCSPIWTLEQRALYNNAFFWMARNTAAYVQVTRAMYPKESSC